MSLLDNVVTCLDVNLGAFMYWHVMSLYVKMAITWLDFKCVIAGTWNDTLCVDVMKC